MPSSVHAILGASSAGRWIACPGSVREIADLPEWAVKRSSRYASEGTAAHYLGELCLTQKHDPLEYQGQYISDFGVIADAIDASLPGEWFEIGDEMVDGVQLYIDTVASYLAKFPNAEVFYEKTVYPVPGRDEEMFGTGDCVIYEPYGELIVIDFKYGKGIQVEADWNDQMMYYALGAMRAVGGAADVSRVTVVIVQPRGIHGDGPVRSWSFDVDALLQFAGVLVAAADATKDPNAPLVPGKHCETYFCPVAATCPAMRANLLAQARIQFPDDIDDLPTVNENPGAHVRLPDPHDPVELSKAKRVADLADYWSKQVNIMLQAALERGQVVPGYKLVRKRAHRAWRDEADVERRLKNMAGLKVDDIYTRKLRSPAQIEKTKAGKEWVAKHAIKPEGDVTVALDSDSRPEVAPQIEAFASVPDGDLE